MTTSLKLPTAKMSTVDELASVQYWPGIPDLAIYVDDN